MASNSAWKIDLCKLGPAPYEPGSMWDSIFLKHLAQVDKPSHISLYFWMDNQPQAKIPPRLLSKKNWSDCNLLSKLTLIRGKRHSRCQSVVPTQNGGQGSCFLPKTDKQVSHSDSDELTPGSSVRRVINVAYLLGTELCVFSAPPPLKENADSPEWEHSFFLIGSHHYCYIHFLSPRGRRD